MLASARPPVRSIQHAIILDLTNELAQPLVELVHKKTVYNPTLCSNSQLKVCRSISATRDYAQRHKIIPCRGSPQQAAFAEPCAGGEACPGDLLAGIGHGGQLDQPTSAPRPSNRTGPP